jgi:hypothetical protein
LQDGRPSLAELRVDDAAAVSMNLAAHDLGAGTANSDKTSGLEGYRGATVLNAQGVRIGEVKEIRDGSLVISLRGLSDLFGFIDFGGRETAVPLNQVLLGRRKTLGSTFVAIPTDSTSVNDILSLCPSSHSLPARSRSAGRPKNSGEAVPRAATHPLVRSFEETNPCLSAQIRG